MSEKYNKLNLQQQEEIYFDIINKEYKNKLVNYILEKYDVVIGSATIYCWFKRGTKPLDNVERWRQYNKINNVRNPPLRNPIILKKAMKTKIKNRLKYENENFIITKEIEQILLGSLLGDGFVGINKRAKNAYYREAHCLKQKEYLLWKNKFLNFKITENKIFIKERKKWKYNITIGSKHFTYLTKLRKLFYLNGKKSVTREILDRLEPLGIAVWYMDDGSYNYRDDIIVLCTDCFSLDEHNIIANWFKEKYDIIWKITKIRNQYRLQTRDIEKFIKLIKSYIIPSMEYKLGLDIERIEMEKRKKYLSNKKRYWGSKRIGWKNLISFHKIFTTFNNIYRSFIRTKLFFYHFNYLFCLKMFAGEDVKKHISAIWKCVNPNMRCGNDYKTSKASS